MGFCLYGNDIDDESSPIEAGLSWITKTDKVFTSSELFKNQKENVIKELRFKTENYTLFNVNLASQLFRLGEIEKSKKCIINCIKNINNSHKFWNLAKSSLLDISFIANNKGVENPNNLFFQ